MKKQQINNLLSRSESVISSFFQKLPEMFILFAIPVLLFAYIFVKPQLTQNQNNQKVTRFDVVENGEDIDERLRTLMSDAQTDLINGTQAADLENYSENAVATGSAIPKLDLVGPWSCETSDASGLTTKLYINNQSIKLITQTEKGTEHTLLKDECIYSWLNNGDGKKQCSGISEILAIAEFASQSGLFDISNMIDKMGGESANEYKSLAASCKKTQFNSAIFSAPQGIKWVEDDVIKLEK